MNKENGSISVIVAVLMSVLFIGASVFGIWAFSQSQTYKNDVDEIVEDEVAIAVQLAETAKDAEFAEKEKSPTITYTASSTFGSLSFKYPKTWSVYDESSGDGSTLSLYAHPKVVHDISSGVPFALRVEVVENTYDEEVESYSSEVKSGALKSRAFRPEKVKNALGVRLDGEIENEVTGTVVLLPLRDKTIKFITESTEYSSDFNNIILPSITYNP